MKHLALYGSVKVRVARVYHIREGKVNARWELSEDTQRVAAFFAG